MEDETKAHSHHGTSGVESKLKTNWAIVKFCKLILPCSKLDLIRRRKVNNYKNGSGKKRCAGGRVPEGLCSSKVCALCQALSPITHKQRVEMKIEV